MHVGLPCIHAKAADRNFLLAHPALKRLYFCGDIWFLREIPIIVLKLTISLTVLGYQCLGLHTMNSAILLFELNLPMRCSYALCIGWWYWKRKHVFNKLSFSYGFPGLNSVSNRTVVAPFRSIAGMAWCRCLKTSFEGRGHVWFENRSALRHEFCEFPEDIIA
jgi:hypothetical protein